MTPDPPDAATWLRKRVEEGKKARMILDVVPERYDALRVTIEQEGSPNREGYGWDFAEAFAAALGPQKGAPDG